MEKYIKKQHHTIWNMDGNEVDNKMGEKSCDKHL